MTTRTGQRVRVRRLMPVASLLTLIAVMLVDHFAYAQYSYPSLSFTTLNGGDLCTPGTKVTTQYYPEVVFPPSSPGILESQALTNLTPYPGDVCMLAGPNIGEEFQPGDITMQFPQGASLVQLDAGSECTDVFGTLTAYTCQGVTCNPVGPSQQLYLNNGSVDVAFMVGADTPVINQAVFSTTADCINAIDNLTVTGNPPPQTLPPYPALQATVSGGPDYTAGGIVVEGLYSGTALSQLVVTLTELQTQSGQPSVLQTTTLPLNSETVSNAQLFQVLAQPGTLALGTYRVDVVVTDDANQSATFSYTVSNFTSGAGPTDPTAGTFQFGVNDVNCQYAFYSNGAIAQLPGSAGGGTIVVPQRIAQKWLSVQSPTAPLLWPNATLGCPLAASTFVVGNYVNGQGGWIQEFEHGRIYLPPQMPVVYATALMRTVLHNIVPTELVNGAPRNTGVASEVLQVGWPATDPDFDLDVDNPTWLFQRFSREGNVDPVTGPATWNTIEIRGGGPFSSPAGITLFVERIGGDLAELGETQADPSAGTFPNPTPTFGSTSPTIWQEFPCAMGPTDKWPTSCDLSGLQPLEGIPPNNYRPISSYCTANPGNDSSQDSACDKEQNETTCGTDNCNMWQWAVPPGLNQVGQASDLVTDIKAWNTTVPYAQGPSLTVPDMNVYHGIVIDSALSGGDNPFNHAYCLYPSDDSWTGLLEDFVSGLACIVNSYGSDVAGCVGSQYAPGITWCRSDWDTHARPLPTLNDWNFLGYTNVYNDGNKESNGTYKAQLEIEFEQAFGFDYLKNFEPWPGDLITVHGRQVIDCVHCPYHSEIHPPDIVAVSRSDVFLHPFSNTTDPNVRVTQGYLWANAFLQNPGGVITSPRITINPPPRTSATALLYVYQQEKNYYQVSGGVGPQFNTANDGEQVWFAGTNLSSIVETPAGQWIYPGSVSSDAQLLPWTILPDEDTVPNPPNELTGPRYVDHWTLAWTPVTLF
jgi:hypothetical protein